MDAQKIDQFIMMKGKNFPQDMIPQIKSKLESLDADKESMIMSVEWKNPTVGFVFAFFLGNLGVDRFWLGQTGVGVAKLLTCGGCWIWSLIDLFTVMNRTRQFNYNKFMMMC